MQFIKNRLELLNGGEGFRDRFEEECKYADSLNTQHKYREWLSVSTFCSVGMEGGADGGVPQL